MTTPGSKTSERNLFSQYEKLKLSFLCMLVLNAILLLVVVICMCIIVSNVSKMNPPEETEPTQAGLRSPTVQCHSIKAKLNKLYRNGQMVDNVTDDVECTMGDLMDSFVQVCSTSVCRSVLMMHILYHI